MKINKKITLLEIFLVVSSIFAFAWIAGSPYNENLYNNEIEEILEFIFLIPIVSAQTTSSTSCCTNLKDGSVCQDLPSDTCNELCASSCIPSSCGAVSQCELGCGFSKSEGTCTLNTPKASCDNNEDCEFLEDPFCSDPKCQKGCCTIGLNTHWYTPAECQIRANAGGVSYEFDRSVENEQACFRQSSNLEEGACVFNNNENSEGNDCLITTQINCDDSKGIFYKDLLCSNNALNTRCKKESYVSCVNGRDGVYWFDSCGNRENIYGTVYNGKIKSPSESCNPNTNNINSGSCGNCNYNLGSICGVFRPGVDRGNMKGYTCRDLNCKDSKGKTRIHKESWCVYDGPIGSGSIFSARGESRGLLSGLLSEFGLFSTDLVGSRHFRQLCNNGEIEVEPCDDYRKEICVQNKKKLDNGREVDGSICRVNMWEQCIGYNTNEGCGAACIGKCIANPDCRVHPVFVDEGFKFTTCVPKYPPGFDLGSTSGLESLAQNYIQDSLGDSGSLGNLGGIASQLTDSSENSASQICSLASQKCTSVWVKTCGLSGIKWECVKNCNCHKAGFTVQMNNLCISLGDCGVYANIEGKVTTNGAYVSKKGKHGATPLQPFFLIPVYFSLAKILKPIPPSGGFYKDESDILNLPTGIVDQFLGGFNRISGASSRTQLQNLFGDQLGTTIGITTITLIGTQAILGSILVGSGSGFFGGLFSGPIFGFDPISIAIGIAIGIGLTYALGCGKVETTEIQFQCQPWQRPKGGDDCEKCSKDPLKPCTKYRCESLGARCTLFNEDTGVQECISIKGEDTIPIISPWEDILNKSLYKYTDVSSNGFKLRTANGECVQALTPVIFGVKTDIHANCRWATQPFDYENLTDSSPDFESLVKPVYVKNHTLLTFLPDVESILLSELNPNELLDSETEIEIRESLLNQLEDLNIYIKCANIDGVSNDADYRINFCVSPGDDVREPVILNTLPSNNNVTRFDATEQNAVFFISEPSECKWDITKPNTASKTESFNMLANTMTCDTNIESGTLFGWLCNTTLPITANENKFFVQCKDQPWLENSEDKTKRNIGNIFEYVLRKSQSELKIDSIKPNGTIYAGTEPIIVEIEVETSGGSNNGEAFCQWGFEQDNMIDSFKETNGILHSYILNQMIKGSYQIFVKCNDAAGNIAEGNTSFVLDLDNLEPVITRVFSNNANLFLATNEISRCFYNETQCGFSLDQSIEFQGANSQVLNTPLIENIDYYIKCQDIWNNSPDSCSIIVRSFEDV